MESKTPHHSDALKARIGTLMKQALAGGVFPGAVLMVWARGRRLLFEAYGYANLFSKEKMTRYTVFDLASLTKPLATTLGLIKLMQSSKLDLEQRLGDLLPAFGKTEKAKISIRHLLGHTSGLPAYRPYFKALRRLPFHKRRKALQDLLIREPLVYPTGAGAVYSDLGFMVLTWILETVAKMRLDDFIQQKIYFPLGISDLFFGADRPPERAGTYAATEWCPWRHTLLCGEVHDDNAYILGGVAGHAGLFGNADGLMTLWSKVLDDLRQKSSSPYFDPKLLAQFMDRERIAGRALGFDMPSKIGSSCGKHFSAATVGHLGYTGTSFWHDLIQEITIILLTNRVHPSRYNDKIRYFRPKLHDMIMEQFVSTHE